MLQKNFRHLYADIAWYGVLVGSTLAFLSVYLARLGADSLKIGLLTAGPALVNLLFSLPIGSFLGNRQLTRVPYRSAFLQRLGYLLLVFLPWLFGEQQQISIIILLVLVFAGPGTMLAISINAVLAEIVPIEHRAEVVGKRNAFLAISTTLSALISGMLLDRISFPLNYQIIFGLGWLGSALSTYHLGQLKSIIPTATVSNKQSLGSNIPPLDRIKRAYQLLKNASLHVRFRLSKIIWPDLLSGSTSRFMAAYLFFYTFQYQGGPIFPLFYVQSLQLSDGMISLGYTLFYISMFVSSLRLMRLSSRFGHHSLLASSAFLFGIYPLLLGLADGPLLYWAASILGGLVYGVVSASLLNRLMEVVPEGRRAAGMSLHNIALNLGILFGSLSGPVLVSFLGLREAMFWVAALRSMSGIILLFWA